MEANHKSNGTTDSGPFQRTIPETARGGVCWWEGLLGRGLLGRGLLGGCPPAAWPGAPATYLVRAVGQHAHDARHGLGGLPECEARQVDGQRRQPLVEERVVVSELLAHLGGQIRPRKHVLPETEKKGSKKKQRILKH